MHSAKMKNNIFQTGWDYQSSSLDRPLWTGWAVGLHHNSRAKRAEACASAYEGCRIPMYSHSLTPSGGLRQCADPMPSAIAIA
eukprot:2381085-Karenia_brevis.AAC.1